MPPNLSKLQRAMAQTRFSPMVYDQDNWEVFDVEMCVAECPDFDTPEGRQRWNDMMLLRVDRRYLVGRYIDDRTKLLSPEVKNPKREGRSIHMGVDLFCKDLEAIHSPWQGKIIERGEEPAPHGFGGWILVEHEPLDGEPWWSLFAHMELPRCQRTGAVLDKGEIIGYLGDHDTNGGWSRHLHYQLFAEKPVDLFGYVVPDDLPVAMKLCPSPYYVLGMDRLHYSR